MRLFALAFLVFALAGCTKSDEPSSKTTPPSLKIATAPEKPPERPPAVQLDPRTHQPFKDAVLLEPPESYHRPPDMTAAGKVVGKIYEDVANRWDHIVFASTNGPIRFTATLKTDLGDIVVELWPEVAPNHVRSFLALAGAGYYNGLPFHRTEVRADKDNRFAYLESGCPLGTGEFGSGSIGYWLKQEPSEKKHEEGTLGAWTNEGTSACKFYITLSKAPGMDGRFTIFGKVIQGLDIAHRISRRPVVDEIEHRPREPVLIREVAIRTGP